MADALGGASPKMRWLRPIAVLALQLAVWRYPEGLALRRLPRSKLASLGLPDRAAFAVLISRGHQDLTIREILAVAKEPATGPLVARILSTRAGSASERSEVLFETIGLSAASAGRAVVGAALLTVVRVAATLRKVDAEGILKYCFEVVLQGNDPYDQSPLPGRAAAAAVAILQERSDLDPIAYTFAKRVGGSIVIELLAAALRGRPNDRPDAVAQALVSLSLTQPKALQFAEDCDVRSEVGGRPRVLPSQWAVWVRWSWRTARSMVVLSAVPLLALVAAEVATASWLPSLDLKIDLPAAIAVLAVLVAAHVVAAQLAADRLPGLIASHTSFPTPLLAGYLAAVGLVAVAVGEGDKPNVRWMWTSVVLLIEVAACVFLSLRQLLQRTDSATAAEAFFDAREASARRAGRQMGKIQRTAKETVERLEDIPYVRLRTAPARTQRRTPSGARSRGFFLVRLGRVERLGSRPEWASGKLSLSLKNGLGTVVRDAEEVLAVVPDGATEVSAIDLRRARRVLDVKDPSDIEKVAEGCSTLIGITSRLAEQGNAAGAQRAARAAVALLRAHLAAAHRENGQRQSGMAEPSPVIPALAMTIRLAASRMRESKTSTERDVLCELLEDILDFSESRDAAATMVASACRDFGGPTLSLVGGRLLRSAGVRSLENGDSLGLMEVWDQFEYRLVKSGADCPDLLWQDAAEIAANAVWIDYSRAASCWRRFWKIASTAASSPLPNSRLLLAGEIGAAALRAGVVSVAVEIVIALRAIGVDFVKLQGEMLSPNVTSRFKFWSDVGGGYLGENPAGALASFAGFAITVGPAIV